MVVDNLNIKGIPVFPSKADTPLIVDPDAVLSRSITSQGLQTVAGWHADIRQIHRIFQQSQFSSRDFVKIAGKPFYPCLFQMLSVRPSWKLLIIFINSPMH